MHYKIFLYSLLTYSCATLYTVHVFVSSYGYMSKETTTMKQFRNRQTRDLANMIVKETIEKEMERINKDARRLKQVDKNMIALSIVDVLKAKDMSDKDIILIAHSIDRHIATIARRMFLLGLDISMHTSINDLWCIVNESADRNEDDAFPYVADIDIEHGLDVLPIVKRWDMIDN